jgi:hypothetical protein
MESGDPTIDAIAAYNRDDCVSTWGLRSGSRRRIEAGPLYPEASFRGRKPSTRAVGGARGRRARPGPRGALRVGVPADRAERDEGSRAAGCSPRFWTGIAARRSPVVGPTGSSGIDRQPRGRRFGARWAGSSGTSVRSRTHASTLPVRPLPGDEAPRRRQPARPTTGQGAGEIRLRCGGCSAQRGARPSRIA